MASIKVEVGFTIFDGCDIAFKAPCDASAVTNLIVYYPNVSGEIKSQTFTFKDANGNDLANINNLFASGAMVKVILDTINNGVYIVNADTNAYLESKFKETIPAERGGTGEKTLKDSMNAFINSLGTGTDMPVDDDYFVSQYVNGGDTTQTYHRRKLKYLWAYIKSKADEKYEQLITTLPISKGGTGETNRLISVTLNSVKGTGSNGCRYYPYLKMCFLRMQVIGIEIAQGTATVVGVVPSDYRPSYINALSVYYSGYGTIVKASISSNGEIRILSSADLNTSAGVYITGWWIVS